MNPIELIFKGKDETGPAVASVKDGLDSIAESSAKASEDVSGIFSIQATQAMLEWKDAATTAFSAVADAGKEFVDAAAEAELVGVRMEATIKALGDRAPTTANQINELADELSKLTGFDDEELVEAQATLARMGSVSEENFERATRAATDLAAATGMDLKSAFQSVGMAMENADFGRLARQIGDLPPEMQAAAKEALKMGDALKVQEIILSGIEQKVDGAGEAIGETFTGQMNKLRTEYGNFQESVGTPLISLFENMPGVVKSAGFAVYGLGQTFGPVVSSVADLAIATRGLNAALGGQGLIGLLNQIKIAGATSFGPMLVQLGLVAIAVAAVVAVWAQWNEQIVKTNEEGKKAVESAWSAFFKDLEEDGKSASQILDEYAAAQERTKQVMEETNPIIRAFVFNKKDLVQADEELRQSLIRVTGSEEEAARMMEEYKQRIQETAQVTQQGSDAIVGAGVSQAGFWQSLPQIISFALREAGNSLNMLGQIASISFATILQQASQSSQMLIQIVSLTFITILQQASQSSQMLVQIVQIAWQQMTQAVQQWFARIVASVTAFWSRLRASFQRIISEARNWGTSIVQGIWAGIQNGWTWLLNMIRTNINSLLTWVKGLLGISSPSKEFAKIGESMALGIGAGFTQGMKSVKPEMDILVPKMQPVFATAGGYGRNTTINVTGGFYSPVTQAERRRIRREQEAAAERTVLRSLR